MIYPWYTNIPDNLHNCCKWIGGPKSDSLRADLKDSLIWVCTCHGMTHGSRWGRWDASHLDLAMWCMPCEGIFTYLGSLQHLKWNKSLFKDSHHGSRGMLQGFGGVVLGVMPPSGCTNLMYLVLLQMPSWDAPKADWIRSSWPWLIIWLVVTGTWILISHILGIIIPIDYFSEGFKPPTSYGSSLNIRGKHQKTQKSIIQPIMSAREIRDSEFDVLLFCDTRPKA